MKDHESIASPDDILSCIYNLLRDKTYKDKYKLKNNINPSKRNKIFFLMMNITR
jgi:hypothetical protein